MENEFRLQTRIELVVLANIVQGLKHRGDVTAFRSLNALVQSAMKIAENILVMEMPEEKEIIYVEDAIEILEETKLFHLAGVGGTSSANSRAVFRTRKGESTNQLKRDLPNPLPRNMRNRLPQPTEQEIEEMKEKLARTQEMVNKGEANIENLPEKHLQSPGVKAFLEAKKREEALRFAQEHHEPLLEDSTKPDDARRHRGDADVIFNE